MTPRPIARGAAGFELSPTFTLGTALAWLGHNCPGLCPEPAVGSRATVWIRRLPCSTEAWTQTLVEFAITDPTWSRELVQGLAGDVNRCVRTDRIRVRARTEDERARFLEALARRRDPLGAR